MNLGLILREQSDPILYPPSLDCRDYIEQLSPLESVARLAFICPNSPLFSDYMGVLDAEGRTTTKLDVAAIPEKTLGMHMSFACSLFYPWDFVFDPACIEIAEQWVVTASPPYRSPPCLFEAPFQ